MKILVTGATGFVGKHIVNELYNQNIEIIALARKTSDISSIKKIAEIRYGDLLDISSLKKATKGVDLIVNTAASTPNSELSGSYLANTIGVKNLIKAAKFSKVNKIIHISSISVTFKIKEIYAKTKLGSEKIIINSGIDYIILRPAGIYGKGSSDFKKIVKFYSIVPFSLILGSGNHKLQPVYVKDIAKAVYSCIKSPKLKNKIYDLAGPRNLTFNESIDEIHKALSLKRIKIHIHKNALLVLAKFFEIAFPKLKLNPERINIIFQDRIVDISSARRDFNYNPTSFEEGLMETLR